MPRDLKSTDPPDLRVTPPIKPYEKKSSSDSISTLHESISKIAEAVNKSARHTEQIPAIRKKVEYTREKLVQLDTKMDYTTERVAKIEDKVDRGHDCYQQPIITELKKGQSRNSVKVEEDAVRNAEQSSKLKSLSKEVATTIVELDDIKKAPRRMFYGLIGIIITIISTCMGAVWFVSKLTSEVEHEQKQRSEQFKRLESEIKTMSKKSDTTPVKSAIKSLGSDLEDTYGHTRAYESICIDMNDYEKRVVKKALLKRGSKIPISCQR